VAGAERGRRQEDRERAGRVLDEDVAVGQRPMQQLLGVPLVDVNVAEPGRAEEAAVGNGAGDEVDRDGDERGAQRRLHPRRRLRCRPQDAPARPVCPSETTGRHAWIVTVAPTDQVLAEAEAPEEAEAAGPAVEAGAARAAGAVPAGSW
jgi:hypothetical protein